MTDRVIALIPARGGSKGIPHKNLAPVAGKPLVAHSIQQALAAPSIERVIVSTDDEEIARVAKHFGAEVIERPGDISGDDATSESALLHALDQLKEKEGYTPDIVVFLQPTSPSRSPADIEAALATLRQNHADSLFSACPVEGFLWRVEAGQDLRSVSYDYRHRRRRQESAEELIENGSIYLFKPAILRKLNNRLGGKIAIYRMDPLDSFQIDRPEDLERTEWLMLTRSSSPGEPFASADIRLLALDFDGVLTDNRVLVDQNGTESVFCHRGDGLGLERLRNTGITTLVLSKERNPVVQARCRKLGIPCHQGFDEKLPQLKNLARDLHLERHQVAYVGNDVNDLDCIEWAGIGVAVGDAEPAVLSAADYVTRAPGGRGAVREICEILIAALAVSSDVSPAGGGAGQASSPVE